MTVEALFPVTNWYYQASAPDDVGCGWFDTSVSPVAVRVQTDVGGVFVTLGYLGTSGSDLLEAFSFAPRAVASAASSSSSVTADDAGAILAGQTFGVR